MISQPNYHQDYNFLKKLPGVPNQKLVHRVNSIQQDYIPLSHLPKKVKANFTLFIIQMGECAGGRMQKQQQKVNLGLGLRSAKLMVIMSSRPNLILLTF